MSLLVLAVSSADDIALIRLRQPTVLHDAIDPFAVPVSNEQQSATR